MVRGDVSQTHGQPHSKLGVAARFIGSVVVRSGERDCDEDGEEQTDACRGPGRTTFWMRVLQAAEMEDAARMSAREGCGRSGEVSSVWIFALVVPLSRSVHCLVLRATSGRGKVAWRVR